MILMLAIGLMSRVWTQPIALTLIVNPAVNESSGVGVSTKYPGIYYTHNDSGDSARFFRFKKDGVPTAISVQGASAIDWEDMACIKVNGKNQLYFADFGDNLSIRTNVKVYRFEEPPLNATSVSVDQTYTINYPDGAHNCEALIVDPATGDIYFATKSTGQTDVYRLAAPPQSGSYSMTKLGTIFPNTGGGNPGKLVTSGNATPSGSYVVLRTYTGALEYKVNGPFQTWWTQTPMPIATPNHAQGEAIAYGSEGRSLLTTSEGTPCPVHSQRALEMIGPQR